MNAQGGNSSDRLPDSPLGGMVRDGFKFAGAFLAYAGPNAGWAGALVVLGSLLENIGLVLLIPILGLVTNVGQGPGAGLLDRAFEVLGATSQASRLFWMLAAFAGLLVIRAVVLHIRDLTLTQLQTGFVEDQRNRLIRRLAEASWGRVSALSHARVITLLGVDILRLGASANVVIQGALAVVMLILQGGLAFVLAPRMTLAAVGLALAGGFLAALRLGRARRVGQGVSQANHSLMGVTASFLGGLKSAVAQNTRAGFVREFETVQADIRKGQLLLAGRQSRSRLAVSTVAALAGLAVVWFGFHDFATEPAVLITVILVFARMTGPVTTLVQSAEQFFASLPAFESLRAVEEELDIEALSSAAPVLPPGAIELKEVAFLHPGGGGLREASLRLEPGMFLGVTGPSGAGKTTLVDLLVGLRQPSAGRITVGGADLREMALTSWRNGVAYVVQDAFLFHDTVRRNLIWGQEEMGEGELWRALEIAGAADLVRRLDQGLDTIVGERGTRLSGGERQRIAIARALLRHPRLLVLDEATNAIDVAGEAALLDRLAALESRPVIVMVAHRAETLVRCDLIATVADGVLQVAPR